MENEKDAFNFSYCTDPKFKLSVLKQNPQELCDICLLKEWKPVRYGEFIVKKTKSVGNLQCHYFCLLSATCIPQRGKTSSGITGFLIRDIIDSFQEFRPRRCVYCQRLSAPIKCSHDGCDRWYHYICGYDKSCITQFIGQHKSFCDQHLPEEQRIVRQTQRRECEICFEVLPQLTDEDYNPVAIVRACGDDERCSRGLMHRECLQQYAFSAGYNFRCPLCFTKDYRTYAEYCGIFVPNRDASWEREPGAFKDLHKTKCTSESCKFVNDREANNVTNMVGCSLCGSQTMHKACTKLTDPSGYLCNACMDETFIKLL